MSTRRQITIRVSVDLFDRLKNQAKCGGRSVNAEIEMRLELALHELELLRRWRGRLVPIEDLVLDN